MKRIKKWLAGFLALTLFFSSASLTVVHATPADDAKYTAMFSVAPSAFYMTCQPDSAIILTESVQLTQSMLSPNYRGGVVDLPRLSSGYYYKLSSENKEYMLGDTLYPTLMWNDAAIGTITHLSICDQQTGAIRCTVSIAIDISDAAYMKGIDSHYLTEHDVPKPGGGTETVYTVDFEDTSESIVRDLVAEGGGMRHYKFPSGSFKIYDAEMHSECIVMDNYAYTPDDVREFPCLNDYQSNYEYTDFESNAYVFAQNEGATQKITNNIKNYLGTLDSGVRSGLLFYGSKTTGCIFNPNTGEATTTTEITDTRAMYYFIALSSGCYFSKITGGVASNELLEVSQSSPTMTWSSDKLYSLQSGVDWLDAGFTGNPSTTNVNYLRYGPVNYDDFVSSVSKYKVSVADSNYTFRHTLTQSVTNINVFARSLIYNASIPHIGRLSLQPALNTITVNYYYQKPETENWILLKEPVAYNAAQFNSVELETLPEIPNYDPVCWYTDMGLATAVNKNSYSKTQTQVINLYGGYKYSGKHYTVTYYNDYTKKTDAHQYKITEQPTLPDTPKGAAGTNFQYWNIVNSKEDTKGLKYDPNTFSPVVDGNYIFKTVWGNAGVITKVVLDQTTYTVGDTIDYKKVHVFTKNDSGLEVEAKTTDYTTSDTYIRKAGDNSITLTLVSTGYTYTFTLKGVKKTAKSISAKYSGGDVIVGSQLQPSAFVVTVEYTDGKSGVTQDFSITPITVKRVGQNTVTIKYLDLSTNCIVNGIEKSEYKELVNVSYITAKYVGKTVYVGDKLKASDFLVTAFYENGSKVTVASTDFSFSPAECTTPGKQIVMCTFQGQSVGATVKVKEKPVEEKPDKPDKPDDSGSSNVTPIIPDTDPDYDKDTSDNWWQNLPSDTDNGYDTDSSTNTDNGYGTDSSTNTDTNTDNTYPDFDLGDGGSSTVTEEPPTYDDSDDTNTPEEVGPLPTVHTTSVGYLSGANIFTNVLTSESTNPLGTVNISEMIENANEAESVFVNLTNGYNGNQLTTEELNLIKDKRLNCFVSMMDPVDNTTAVAEWVFRGAEMPSVNYSINPNIIFETTETDDGTLLYFAMSQETFPAGVNLSVTPPTRTFTPGDLVRLYTCNANYENANNIRALTWLDDHNGFQIDLLSNFSYCLSNALAVVEEGGSLKEAPIPSSNESDPPSDTTEGGDTEEPFDFDIEDDDKSPTKSKKTIVIFILIGMVSTALVVVGGTALFKVIRHKRMMKG